MTDLATLHQYGSEMCTKCGNGRYGGVQLIGQPYQQENSVVWHLPESNCWFNKNTDLDPRPEHLHYTCARCGFQWATLTMGDE